MAYIVTPSPLMGEGWGGGGFPALQPVEQIL